MLGNLASGRSSGRMEEDNHQTWGIQAEVMRVGHRLSESLGRKETGIDHLHQRNGIDKRGREKRRTLVNVGVAKILQVRRGAFCYAMKSSFSKSMCFHMTYLHIL